MTTCPISPELLNAYVDSELAADTSATISAHLATCARCSLEYQALLATVAVLRSSLVRHTAPDVLRARVRGAIAAQPLSDTATTTSFEPPPAMRRLPRWTLVAAAAVVCLALGAGTTLLAVRGAASVSPVADEVLASHLRSLMPEHLTDVRSNDQHNVKPWFNGRLDFSPSVPRLDSAGFPLIGGRLDYVGDRAVASVVYGRRQHIINVFSWPTAAANAPVAFAASHGYNMLHWRERGVEQWLVSDVNAADLRMFGALLRNAER